MYECNICHTKKTKPMNICPNCNAVKSFVPVEQTRKASKSTVAKNAFSDMKTRQTRPQRIGELSGLSENRVSTGIAEFDRVLGGGLVAGEVVILGGNPGVGKSTLLMKVSDNFAQAGLVVLYNTAEESMPQIKMRADRLGVDSENLYVVFESSLESLIESHLDEVRPNIIILDSIHKMISREATGAPGSISQLTYCEYALEQYAKANNVPIIMIGQVTKAGTIAGNEQLIHNVDCVLYLEGDKQHLFRLLRAEKNRFGDVGEIGVFEMQESGLEEVPNPSHIFLSEMERGGGGSGSAIAVLMEGQRPILVEMQALVAVTSGTPARRANGVSRDKVFTLAAIMQNYLGLHLHTRDIIASIAGGMSTEETAVDASLACAIFSSYFAQPVEGVAIGEIGLSGELRRVSHLSRRVKEAVSMGFSRIIVPPNSRLSALPQGVTVCEAKNIQELMELAFPALPATKTPEYRKLVKAIQRLVSGNAGGDDDDEGDDNDSRHRDYGEEYDNGVEM